MRIGGEFNPGGGRKGRRERKRGFNIEEETGMDREGRELERDGGRGAEGEGSSGLLEDELFPLSPCGWVSLTDPGRS